MSEVELNGSMAKMGAFNEELKRCCPLPSNASCNPMELRRNRYDPVSILSQLDRQVPSRDGDDWCLHFRCPEEDPELDEFLAYLPPSPIDHPRTITLLRDFLARISQLDNLVQDSCESDWAKSHYDISNYKLHIAYITPADETVSVEYFGTIVNTQWTAIFRRAPSGEWQKDNF